MKQNVQTFIDLRVLAEMYLILEELGWRARSKSDLIREFCQRAVRVYLENNIGREVSTMAEAVRILREFNLPSITKEIKPEISIGMSEEVLRAAIAKAEEESKR